MQLMFICSCTVLAKSSSNEESSGSCEYAKAPDSAHASAMIQSRSVAAKVTSHDPVAGAEAFGGKDATSKADSYEEYVKGQRSKTDGILRANGTGDQQWVNRDDIYFLAKYMRDTLRLPMKNKLALAHGTRSGHEQTWFREALPGEEAWGTELSPLATSPYTVNMDFHVVPDKWLGKVDFVYSNALDHSYNATYAVEQWMKEVSSDGVLIIEWSEAHTKEGLSGNVDIFGGSLEEFKNLIVKAGPCDIVAVVPSPTRKSVNVQFIFAKHSKAN